MYNTTINLKTDQQTKKQAQKIAEEMGFSLSSIINAYLKQFVRNKKIEIRLYDISALKEKSWETDRKNAQKTKGYKSADKLLDDLL
ncbi:MAG: type II toxin-antitoxin system RelB/DinJ family antitoxin [Candidatus Gracilibacteria bacterium]|nr:type II toxin-antitoxin system RelB/DinJ family antitoxin [Candidatus Gracilibacteria bacterium]